MKIKKTIMALSLVGATMFSFAQDVTNTNTAIEATNVAETNNVAKIEVKLAEANAEQKGVNPNEFNVFTDEDFELTVSLDTGDTNVVIEALNIPSFATFDGYTFKFAPKSEEGVKKILKEEKNKDSANDIDLENITTDILEANGYVKDGSEFKIKFLTKLKDGDVEKTISTDVTLTVTKRPPSGFESFINELKKGGKTMIFLGILSILGLGCAIERACTLRRKKIVPDGFSSTVIELWKNQQFDDIRQYCSTSNSALARVVETMLEHKDAEDYQQVKIFAEDKAGRELRFENRKSSMLSTVATIAPLLGLFGTVLGLLGAFSKVAAVGEMGDPSILANEIGMALVTTVAGLAISMPCLFIYNIIKNKLNLYAIFLEEEVNDIINHLFVQRDK